MYRGADEWLRLSPREATNYRMSTQVECFNSSGLGFQFTTIEYSLLQRFSWEKGRNKPTCKSLRVCLIGINSENGRLGRIRICEGEVAAFSAKRWDRRNS